MAGGADNATIRIILDGTGAAPGAPAPDKVAPTPPRPTPAAPTQVQQATALSTRAPRPVTLPEVSEELRSLAWKYRGLLGSVFNSFVGTVLDMMVTMRKAESAIPTVYPATQEAANLLNKGGKPQFQAPAASQPAGFPSGFGGAPQSAQTGIQRGASPAGPFPQVQAEELGADVTTGAGGASMMAGVAAGVGIAAAVIAALKMVKDRLYGVTQAIGGMSAFITADTSPANYISSLGASAKSAGDAIFMINPVLGIFANTVGGATQALGQFMKVLDAQVDRYSGFSPQLSVAAAMGELRTTLADFGRAQAIAPDLIRYVEARTELQNQFEDTKIKLLERVVPVVTNIMESISRLWPLIEAGLLSAEMIVEALTGPQRRILEGIASLMPERPRPQDIEMPTDAILRSYPWERGPEGLDQNPPRPGAFG